MVVSYEIKRQDLSSQGSVSIKWASKEMPVVNLLSKRMESEKPFKGITIGLCIHVTKETANLALALKSGGAEICLCGSNPLDTQDDVAASLALDHDIHVFAWRGQSEDDYYKCIDNVLSYGPELLLDDGADMIARAHSREKIRADVVGATEQTTTGIMRLKNMEKEGMLRFPVIDVNDAYVKNMFDNRYGAGQSVIDAIMRSTSMLLAGKTFVVSGYGWVGRGIALRAKAMGCRVVVTEVDPIKALEALMDGYEVMSMEEAARIGDIFVTATGVKDVITKRHMELMKDGAVLANAGHFNVEVSVKDLEGMAVSKNRVRPWTDEYVLEDGKRVYLLAEGRLVNLVAAEGNPAAVMDMSFASQILALRYLAKDGDKLEPKVHKFPDDLNYEVARLKLESMGVRIDKLTEDQMKYVESWRLGT